MRWQEPRELRGADRVTSILNAALLYSQKGLMLQSESEGK